MAGYALQYNTFEILRLLPKQNLDAKPLPGTSSPAAKCCLSRPETYKQQYENVEGRQERLAVHGTQNIAWTLCPNLDPEVIDPRTQEPQSTSAWWY